MSGDRLVGYPAYQQQQLYHKNEQHERQQPAVVPDGNSANRHPSRLASSQRWVLGKHRHENPATRGSDRENQWVLPEGRLGPTLPTWPRLAHEIPQLALHASPIL
ncbi:uncharacterized protein G6M90_00g082000 [Metarhizium brunneum]|uniref:Uncharacterized protein n=1 Tax=Metarhizium brunneum TaxID=500148 RepID=A0A7D5ZAX7_9HYPO|nr:hypothetical protein G6M90_00g082000 [Metarhizium brunneum]